MTKDVAVQSAPQLYFNPEIWKYMEEMSKKFIESKALPATITNAAQLMLTFQAGYELGMKPVESLRNLYIVKGRVAMQGNAMLKKMLEAGVKIVWDEVSGDKVKATFKRDGQDPFVSQLTMAEASTRKLNQNYDYESKSWKLKPTWTQFPDNMLMWKVVSKAGKFYCADIIEGVELYEDIIDVAPVEDAIDKAVPPTEKEQSFDELLEKIQRVRSEGGLEKLKKEITDSSWSAPQQRSLVDAWAHRKAEITNGEVELTEDEAAEAKKYADEVSPDQTTLPVEQPKEEGKLAKLFGNKK